MKERPKIELVCAATGEKFLKDRREYNRQIRNGVVRFFKDKVTASKFISNERRSKVINKICPVCQKKFESSTLSRSSNYCSKSCASKQIHITLSLNPDKKLKRKEKLVVAGKKTWEEIRSGKRKIPQCHKIESLPTIQELTTTCKICEKSFQKLYRTQNKQTCSKNCANILRSLLSSNNPNCGGETNYKRYYYNNILMDSQWEVELAKWLDANNLSWVRDRKMFFTWIDQNKKIRRYHPDFYIPKLNVYLDPKNKFLIEKDRFKIETVTRTHNIKIVWGLLDDVINQLKILNASVA